MPKTEPSKVYLDGFFCTYSRQVKSPCQACEKLMAAVCHMWLHNFYAMTVACGDTGNGKCGSRAVASCAGLIEIFNSQEIVGSDIPASFDSDPLCNIARRPAAPVTELRNPAIGHADLGREVAPGNTTLGKILG